MDTKDAIALWGAMVATILAIIKIFEIVLPEKTKIDTTFSFIGDEGAPDIITLVNTSKTKRAVLYYDIQWIPPVYNFWKGNIEIDLGFEDGMSAFMLEPHEPLELIFKSPYKLSWGPGIPFNYRLVISLRIAGRRFRKKIVVTTK